MGNNFRAYNPKQSFLLPPSPMDWLPEAHQAYFILEVVETLDLARIEDSYAAKDARGERPYSPRMMLAVLVYGYCTGVFSSRKLARALYEDVAFRVLSGGEHPHFTRINDFRLHHREALAELFVQVLKLCERAGLVKLGHVALDGSKILANASKHKAMSYERMQKEEARLHAEVEALLKQAETHDATEDERYGKGNDADELPEELKRRQQRLERIQKAKAELEQEAAQARAEELRRRAEEQDKKAQDSNVDEAERRRAATRAKKSRERADALAGSDGDDDEPKAGGSAELPEHRVAHQGDGKPTPSAQRNFTDPDSRIMVKGGEFVQAYNAQVVVDATAQIIVAQAVTNQPADAEHLPAMLELSSENAAREAEKLSADSGYFSAANVAACNARGVDAYIAVSRDKHGETDGAPTAEPTKGSTIKEEMRKKLATKDGQAIYARRKVIAEPPFGQIKSVRGFRRFSMRGLGKVRCEWSLVCWTHNLLKLFRSAKWQTALAT